MRREFIVGPEQLMARHVRQVLRRGCGSAGLPLDSDQLMQAVARRALECGSSLWGSWCNLGVRSPILFSFLRPDYACCFTVL